MDYANLVRIMELNQDKILPPFQGRKLSSPGLIPPGSGG
jgi:hypothetical protein